jgi:hypothetical protein
MEEMVNRKRSEMGDKSLISLDKIKSAMCEQDSDESDHESMQFGRGVSTNLLLSLRKL